MVSPKYTGKHLKASKNFYKRGLDFEIQVSHQLKKRRVILVVIWPQLLRERNLGQIDLMWIEHNRLIVGECKTVYASVKENIVEYS